MSLGGLRAILHAKIPPHVLISFFDGFPPELKLNCHCCPARVYSNRRAEQPDGLLKSHRMKCKPQRLRDCPKRLENQNLAKDAIMGQALLREKNWEPSKMHFLMLAWKHLTVNKFSSGGRMGMTLTPPWAYLRMVP